MALHRLLVLILSLPLLGFSSASISRDAPLPVAEAFGYKSQVGPEGVRIIFDVATGYHLYLERIKIQPGDDRVAIGVPGIPVGEQVNDPTFGQTRIGRGHIEIPIPITALPEAPETGSVKISYQGCQDDGSCYPPQRESISLADAVINPQEPPKGSSECEAKALPSDESVARSEQCKIVDALKTENLFSTGLSFLGMGLLLAFTPCIFPMIPILSGLIAGQGKNITSHRAFALSLAYVLASAMAYTLFGVLAGLFGHNLQATLQNPSVILAFSGLFIVLALSMFGAFNLQLPGQLQNQLTALSNRQQQGTLLGSATMGFLSALIVGPCVAAPLAGALIYIGETGDALFGGFALFSLGIGMGLPLLVIGTSAGTFLPKAGVWMESVKSVFGFGLLGVALWLLSRIAPDDLMLFLWGGLLILASIALGALESLPVTPRLIQRFTKGAGIILLTYGILLLVGAASKARDPLHPLEKFSSGAVHHSAETPNALRFTFVTSLEDLDRQLEDAAKRQQPVMLDFYAEWCTACQEMEEITFKDPAVHKTLSNVILLKADVTDQTDADRSLLKRFGLIGPPATLFFRNGNQEVIQRRIVGFMEPSSFNRHVIASIGLAAPSITP